LCCSWSLSLPLGHLLPLLLQHLCGFWLVGAAADGEPGFLLSRLDLIRQGCAWPLLGLLLLLLLLH
jgi:hypothetical protein